MVFAYIVGDSRQRRPKLFRADVCTKLVQLTGNAIEHIILRNYVHRAATVPTHHLELFWFSRGRHA